MQHAAQLLLLPISLGWHAAEHGPLASVIAYLRDEDLERAYLVTAHRFHVTSVDGERDRSRFARPGRGWWGRHGITLQSGADAHRPLADRLDFRGVPEREELFEQRAGAAAWQKAPILARVRSYSGVPRSGMISAAGVMVRRDATPHRQGPKRGERTSTTPNNDVSLRRRTSFSGRCAPQRWQLRRFRQCSSACA